MLQDWEEAAFEVVKMTYEDVNLCSPEVMVFDRLATDRGCTQTTRRIV